MSQDRLTQPLLIPDNSAARWRQEMAAEERAMISSMTFDADGHMLDSSILSYEGLTPAGCFPIEDGEEGELPVTQEEGRSSAPIITSFARGSLERGNLGAGNTLARDSVPVQPERPTFKNELSTTLQVAKVILGSGMLVLPKAFQLLGCGLGILLLTTVGCLTWFTVHGLVYAAQKTGKGTYASVVRLACGRPAKWGLLAAVFFNCLGMCVVFVVIFGDILLGAPPEYSGIIRELFPAIAPDSRYLARWVVLMVVVLAILTPLSLQHDLHALGFVAILGVGSVVAFALACMAVASSAAWQGTLQPLPWWPDWDALAGSSSGGDTGSAGAGLMAVGRTSAIVLGIAGVVPLLLNADICHQAIFPTMALLRPYNRKVFNSVVATALALCNLLYIAIALACIASFGDALSDNVLNNMSSAHMAPYLGVWASGMVALLVRLGYFFSLLGSFVFTLHPLRHCVLEVLLGSNFPTKKMHKADRLFVPLTLLLVVLIYVLAVFTPGIWLVLSLVGSAASTFMGFVFPGLVILVIQSKPKWTHYMKRTLAVFVIAIGLFLFVNGFVVLFVSGAAGTKGGR